MRAKAETIQIETDVAVIELNISNTTEDEWVVLSYVGPDRENGDLDLGGEDMPDVRIRYLR